MGLPPQLELLADFSRKLEHENMLQQCNNVCPYSKYEHTVSLRHEHKHRQTVHTFSLFQILPQLELYQTIWLVMHMLYRLATLIVLLHFKT